MTLRKIEKEVQYLRSAVAAYHQLIETETAELKSMQTELQELEFRRYLHTPCYRYKVNG